MILGISQFTDGFAPFSIEVTQGGAWECLIKIGEEIAVIIEHPLLDYIPGAAGSKGDPNRLAGKRFPQKGHGLVKLVLLQLLHARNLEIPAPILAATAGAGNEGAVQYGMEQSPLTLKPNLRDYTGTNR